MLTERSADLFVFDMENSSSRLMINNIILGINHRQVFPISVATQLTERKRYPDTRGRGPGAGQGAGALRGTIWAVSSHIRRYGPNRPAKIANS